MLERTLTKEENSVQIFFFSPGDGPSNRLWPKISGSDRLRNTALDYGCFFAETYSQKKGLNAVNITMQLKKSGENSAVASTVRSLTPRCIS